MPSVYCSEPVQPGGVMSGHRPGPSAFENSTWMPVGRMSTVVKDWVYRGQYRSVDDELAAWDAVTMKDMRAVLDLYPVTNQTVTAYGPLEKLG